MKAIINPFRTQLTLDQIFLETPRARVTLLLAHHHESLTKNPTSASPSPKESKQTASDLLSELQVETYSSMERREKTEFLLEQMRFLIMVAREKDAEKGQEGKSNAIGGGEAEWVKVRVAGRKVNETFLTQKANEVRMFVRARAARCLKPHAIGPETEVLRNDDPVRPATQ